MMYGQGAVSPDAKMAVTIADLQACKCTSRPLTVEADPLGAGLDFTEMLCTPHVPNFQFVELSGAVPVSRGTGEPIT